MILEEVVMQRKEEVNAEANLFDVEQLLRDALKRIDYGTIEITIHDSRVVQVETSQKTRFNTK